MDWKKPEYKRLVQAMIALETPDETRRFLRDILTPNEIDEFAKRLQTAELLSRRVPYSQIETQTGFSSTTIARVSRWLTGGEGGYAAIINKLHHHDTARARSGLS